MQSQTRVGRMGAALGGAPRPPSRPQPERPAQPRCSQPSLPLLRGQPPCCPLAPQALPDPPCPWHPGTPAKLEPQALTSYFSGAPEMRKSLLNRTGGLSPAEKLGLSVTFFLQGRTCQPQGESQASLSLPFLHPIHLRSFTQGTPELFPAFSLWGRECFCCQK